MENFKLKTKGSAIQLPSATWRQKFCRKEILIQIFECLLPMLVMFVMDVLLKSNSKRSRVPTPKSDVKTSDS